MRTRPARKVLGITSLPVVWTRSSCARGAVADDNTDRRVPRSPCRTADEAARAATAEAEANSRTVAAQSALAEAEEMEKKAAEALRRAMEQAEADLKARAVAASAQ